MGIDIVGHREIINDRPFSYIANYGTHFYASRCDFRGGVTVHRPEERNDAQFAVDVSEMTGYHCLNIRAEHLNGFAGYDAVQYDVKVMDFLEICGISDRVMDQDDPYDHYDVTGAERPEPEEEDGKVKSVMLFKGDENADKFLSGISTALLQEVFGSAEDTEAFRFTLTDLFKVKLTDLLEHLIDREGYTMDPNVTYIIERTEDESKYAFTVEGKLEIDEDELPNFCLRFTVTVPSGSNLKLKTTEIGIKENDD